LREIDKNVEFIGAP